MKNKNAKAYLDCKITMFQKMNIGKIIFYGFVHSRSARMVDPRTIGS
jgi:hypothetical protein